MIRPKQIILVTTLLTALLASGCVMTRLPTTPGKTEDFFGFTKSIPLGK